MHTMWLFIARGLGGCGEAERRPRVSRVPVLFCDDEGQLSRTETSSCFAPQVRRTFGNSFGGNFSNARVDEKSVLYA